MAPLHRHFATVANSFAADDIQFVYTMGGSGFSGCMVFYV
jgi:hypothetical protein